MPDFFEFPPEFVALYVRTTGAHLSDGHRLREIALQVFTGGSLGKSLVLANNYSKRTGGKMPMTTSKKILSFIGKRPIVCLEAEHDISFLNSELLDAGFRTIGVDVFSLADMLREIYPNGTPSLEDLCRDAGLPLPGESGLEKAQSLGCLALRLGNHPFPELPECKVESPFEAPTSEPPVRKAEPSPIKPNLDEQEKTRPQKPQAEIPVRPSNPVKPLPQHPAPAPVPATAPIPGDKSNRGYFKGRMPRKEYLVRSLLSVAFIFIYGYLVVYLDENLDHDSGAYTLASLFIVTLPVVWFVDWISINIRRLRAVGLSPWWVLLNVCFLPWTVFLFPYLVWRKDVPPK